MKRTRLRSLALIVLCVLPANILSADTRTLNTPEVPVVDPAYDVAPYSRTHATIASDGEGFLVAWIDSREPTPTVRAARIDARGEVLDPLSIVVARNSNVIPAHHLTVAVAADGEDYLLAYDCGSFDTPAICTSVITRDGIVKTSTARYAGTAPDLAWNGKQYLLGYRRSNLLKPSSQRSLIAQFLTPSGEPVGGEIPLGIGSGAAVALASDGDDFYAAWTFDRVVGRVIHADGSTGPVQAIGDLTRFLSGHNIDIAYNGRGEYLVIWVQEGYLGRGVNARRVSAAGAPLGEPVVVLAEGLSSMEVPGITRVGDRYLITFLAFIFPQSTIRAIYADDNLALTEPISLTKEESRIEQPAAAFDGERATLAFVYDDQVRVHDLASGLTKIVSFSVRAQEYPVVSSSSDHDVIAWLEIAGDDQNPLLYTKRLFARGTGFPVHESDLGQANPAISGGPSPMVFWMEPFRRGDLRATIFGKRLTSSGSPQITEPVRLGETLLSFGLAVTTMGSRHFVIWIALNGQLMLTRVTDEGLLIDSEPIPIVTASSRLAYGELSISSDGSYLFVAWNSAPEVPDPGMSTDDVAPPCQFFCGPELSLHVARLTPDGVVASTSRIVDRNGGAAAVIWTGSEYAVFWASKALESFVPNGLAALRFDRRGRPLDARPVMIDSKPRAGRPQVRWNGREFIEAVVTSPQFETPSEFLVNRIHRDLRLVETITIPSEGRRWPVPVVIGGRDSILYSKTILDYPYLGVPRVVIRSIDELPRSRALRR